ncbi:ABC transporter substrate-binding protein [Psychrobium sp. 1_MG-2023]|uniref:ABC transporter substrate-binding protein n=1 Tax=Psychrobium sp. 1_MG-2023 TaxID=3062624 RepID=UPI0027370D13|nr:ABC transporter substrate-binding protein [Psychrobium sp. 1_MG-2023]MDP2562428.1 ABC transporter substrate-binding protein [Psychrobium sp. 1_MG-2023]
MSLLPVILMMTACNPNFDGTAHLTPGVVYCSEGDPTTFNPQLTTSGTTTDATSYQLYNRLVEYDPELGVIQPGLAHLWHINENGKIYTFYLRKGVKFHQNHGFTPSREFNADDVLFSFNRIIELSHPYHHISGGLYPFFESVGFGQLIDKITKVNDHMVTIHLKEKDSSFLANLAANFAVVLSQEYGDFLLEKNQPQLIDSQPIGTGPFVLDSYFQSNHIRYKPNPHYWDGPPKIEQLVYDITPNSTSRIAKLMTGDCDVSALPQSSELDVLRSNIKLELQIQTGFNVAYWAFNTERAPFDNILVRKALAHAINKKAIVEAVYYGSATIADSILPPLSWAYNEQLTTYHYNPERARQLLEQAGYGDGFTMDLWAAPVQRIYNPNAIKTAELLQGQLAKVGIKVNIISYGWSVFIQKLNSFDYDSVLLGWTADNADPDNFFRPLFSCAAINSGGNRSNWCRPTFDDIVSQAIAETDQAKRVPLYHQAQQKLNQTLPLIPIAHALRFQVKHRTIKGMPLNPYGGVSFAKTYRKKAQQQEQK